MPIPIQNLYTGRDTAVVLPQGRSLERAQYGFQQDRAAGDQAKYGEVIRSQEQLLNLSDVEVQDYISEEAAREQAKWLEEFENEVTDIYSRSDGIPSTRDLLDISSKRRAIESRQGKSLADQKLVLDQWKQYQRNPEDYKGDDVVKNMQEFINTGNVPEQGILELAPVDWVEGMDDWYRDKRYGTDTYVRGYMEDGKEVKKTTESLIPNEERQKNDWISAFLRRDRWIKDATERFDNLNETEQEKYIETAQENDTNAIIEYQWEWMKDNGLIRGLESTKEDVDEVTDKNGGDGSDGGRGDRVLDVTEGNFTTLKGGKQNNALSFKDLKLTNLTYGQLDLDDDEKVFVRGEKPEDAREYNFIDGVVKFVYGNTAEIELTGNKNIYKEVDDVTDWDYKNGVRVKGPQGDMKYYNLVEDVAATAPIDEIDENIRAALDYDKEIDKFNEWLQNREQQEVEFNMEDYE